MAFSFNSLVWGEPSITPFKSACKVELYSYLIHSATTATKTPCRLVRHIYHCRSSTNYLWFQLVLLSLPSGCCHHILPSKGICDCKGRELRVHIFSLRAPNDFQTCSLHKLWEHLQSICWKLSFSNLKSTDRFSTKFVFPICENKRQIKNRHSINTCRKWIQITTEQKKREKTVQMP